MSLVQHFGLRLACKKKLDHNYGSDGGYDPKVLGNEVVLDQLDDCEMKLFDAIEFSTDQRPLHLSLVSLHSYVR